MRYRKAGFNRLSIGVQSADDGLFKSLGPPAQFRTQVTEAVFNARSRFENINGSHIRHPHRPEKTGADTLNKALTLKPEHFSCYGAEKLSKGTPLYAFKDSLLSRTTIRERICTFAKVGWSVLASERIDSSFCPARVSVAAQPEILDCTGVYEFRRPHTLMSAIPVQLHSRPLKIHHQYSLRQYSGRPARGHQRF